MEFSKELSAFFVDLLKNAILCGTIRFTICAIYCSLTEGNDINAEKYPKFLKIEPGMKLLSIRSSDIAFTMGAYGRLVEESMKHEDEIPLI